MKPQSRKLEFHLSTRYQFNLIRLCGTMREDVGKTYSPAFYGCNISVTVSNSIAYVHLTLARRGQVFWADLSHLISFKGIPLDRLNEATKQPVKVLVLAYPRLEKLNEIN